MVSGVRDESRLMKEEVFGPLTYIVPFKTEEEVLLELHYVHVYMYVSLRDYDFKVEGRLPMATIKLHFSWEIGGPVSLIVYVCI